MRRIISHRTAAVLLTAGLLVGCSGVAYAYFTSNGSGTGSASVGTAPSDVFTMASGGPSTALVPGGGGQPFDVTVQNTSADAEHLGTISMWVMLFGDSGDAADSAGNDIPGCSASWFTVTGSVLVDDTVAAGSTVSLSDLAIVPPTITMTETGTNQNACQGAQVGIGFAAAG